MKKYILALLILATTCYCKVSFAQGKAKHHKAMGHKGSKHHVASQATATAAPEKETIVRHRAPTHHKSVARKHEVVRSHHKAVARHHAAKKHPAMREESFVVDDRSTVATVEIKNGNVYVNDGLVFKIKSLKNEDDNITVNYIAPPSAINNAKSYSGNNNSETDNSGPLLGVYTFNYLNEGAMVDGMVPCSPAFAAGLFPGDVIMKINDRDINNSQELVDAIHGYNPGDKVTITYMHFGRIETTEAELADKQKMEPGDHHEMQNDEEKEMTHDQTKEMNPPPSVHRTFEHGRWYW